MPCPGPSHSRSREARPCQLKRGIRRRPQLLPSRQALSPRRYRRPPRRCGGARRKATCRSRAPRARSCAERAPDPRGARAAEPERQGKCPSPQFRRRSPRRPVGPAPRRILGPPLFLRRQELPRPRPSHRLASRRVAALPSLWPVRGRRSPPWRYWHPRPWAIRAHRRRRRSPRCPRSRPRVSRSPS